MQLPSCVSTYCKIAFQAVALADHPQNPQFLSAGYGFFLVTANISCQQIVGKLAGGWMFRCFLTVE